MNKINFSDLLQTLQTDIQAVSSQFFGNIIGNLGTLGKRDLTEILNIVNFIQNTFNVSISQLIKKLTVIYNKYQAQIQQFLSTFNKPQLLAASQTAKAEIEATVRGVISDFANTVQGALISGLNTVIAAGINVASLLGISIGKRGLFDGFGDIINGLTSTLSGHIDNITGSLTSLGSNLVGAVTPHLQDLQDQLTNHALNAAQSLLGTLAGISGTLQG